jgi:hypothetical protein
VFVPTVQTDCQNKQLILSSKWPGAIFAHRLLLVCFSSRLPSEIADCHSVFLYSP